MFGNCSRDFQQERSHAQHLQKMLQLDFNVDHQWLLTEPSKIFHMLSMLKELPQAHYSRIEWLTKRPTIRPVGIEKFTSRTLQQ